MKTAFHFLALLVLFLAAPAFAAPGDLDTTFGATGKVTTSIGSNNDFGESVAVQSDGKIVVAGPSFFNANNNEFAVVRYNVNGSLDTSFNGTGKVTTRFGGNSSAHGVVVQSDEKIVVAGTYENGSNTDFGVVRYNTDGSLDTTFGGTGKVATDIAGNGENGTCVALQSDGKIVVAGFTYNGSNQDIALVRYNANGSLDTSFNGNGKVTTAVGSGNDYAASVAVQTDGKVVVAGYSFSGATVVVAVVRYNANGSLDATFNGTGKVTTIFGSGGNDQARSVTLQSDGKIVIAGSSSNGSDGDFAVLRYNTDGSLDTTFNGSGKVTTAIGIGDDQAFGVTVQGDGKIVAAGYGNNNQFAVARYNPDGSLDVAFNGTGKVTTAIGSGSRSGPSVAIQSNHKIVIAGGCNNGSKVDFAVVRYEGDPTHVMRYYRFEKDNGAAVINGQVITSADDSSGNGRNGVSIGSPTYATTPFVTPVPSTGASNAFSFSGDAGIGRGIILNPDSAPVIGATFTVETFFSLSSTDPGTGDAKNILRCGNETTQPFGLWIWALDGIGPGTNDLYLSLRETLNKAS